MGSTLLQAVRSTVQSTVDVDLVCSVAGIRSEPDRMQRILRSLRFTGR